MCGSDRAFMPGTMLGWAAVLAPTNRDVKHKARTFSASSWKRCDHKSAFNSRWCAEATRQCFAKPGLLQSTRPQGNKPCRQHTSVWCDADQSAGPDISRLEPELQLQFHPLKNAHLGKIILTPKNGRKVWWSCDQCPDGHPHEWQATVANRANGSNCPYCAGTAVCQHNSLATKAPAKAAQFSDKNKGTAHDYTVGSNKKLLWRCEHGHYWNATINSRTSSRDVGCPVCFNLHKRSQTKITHPVVTDSHHPMRQQWDAELNAEAGLDPSKITCGSNIKANWICDNCPKKQPHRWQATICNRYHGSGCPCCSGRKACICNALQSLYPGVAAEWDYIRNKGTPSNYPAHSNAKVWWHNEERGNFQAIIAARTSNASQPHLTK